MSNLASLYFTEFNTALKTLLPNLPASAIAVGYQKDIVNNETFVVWSIRNISQQVFTGGTESRGIDKPTFVIDIAARKLMDAVTIADKIIDTWNGFTGYLTPNLPVAKLIVSIIDHNYDEQDSFHIIGVDVNANITITA